MAIRGMAMDTAAKSRYRKLPKKSLPSPGKLPWTNQRSTVLKQKVSKMAVKKGGTAMHS